MSVCACVRKCVHVCVYKACGRGASLSVPSPGSSSMFSCSVLPPPLFPALLRPPGSLASPLSRSLPPGFLVQDLLQLSQPVTHLHRTLSCRSPTDAVALSPAPCGPAQPPETSTDPPLFQNRWNPERPDRPCGGSGLKFGVSAILAPPPRNCEYIRTSITSSNLSVSN